MSKACSFSSDVLDFFSLFCPLPPRLHAPVAVRVVLPVVVVANCDAGVWQEYSFIPVVLRRHHGDERVEHLSDLRAFKIWARVPWNTGRACCRGDF